MVLFTFHFDAIGFTYQFIAYGFTFSQWGLGQLGDIVSEDLGPFDYVFHRTQVQMTI